MKKNLLLGFMAVMLVAGTILAGCASPAPEEGPAPVAPAEKVYKWKFQSEFPPGHTRYGWETVLIDKIKTASAGRLDIAHYAGQEIVATEESFEALTKGVINISECALPKLGVKIGAPHYSSPGVFKKQMELNYINIEKGGDEIVREALLPLNVYHICSATITGSALITRSEVKTIDDLKGLKIREYGTKAALIEKLGARAVYIPTAEVYVALMGGVLDGIAMFHLETINYKFYEPCKYMIRPELESAAQVAWLVNLDSWNELPDDLKEILNAELLVAAFAKARTYEYMDGLNLTYLEKECGVQISHWSDEDWATIQKAAKEVLEEEAAADPDSAKLIKLYLECSKELGYAE